MIEIIKTALTSPAGSFGFIFGILCLLFWSIHYVTKHITRIKTSHDTLDGSVGKIDKHIDEIRRDLSYLKGSIDVYKSSAEPLTKAHSPISLTQKGMAVATELNAVEIIARNWDNIYGNLEENVRNKNAYDIQEYCLMTAFVDPDNFFEKSDIDTIKQYAFIHGAPLQEYTRLIGVLIRDKYLELKGINISEIDKHAPQKEA